MKSLWGAHARTPEEDEAHFGEGSPQGTCTIARDGCDVPVVSIAGLL